MRITILEPAEITVQEPRKSWVIKNNINNLNHSYLNSIHSGIENEYEAGAADRLAHPLKQRNPDCPCRMVWVFPIYLAGWQVYKKPDAWVMQSENPSGEVIAKLSAALRQYRADSSSPKPKKTRTKIDGHSSNQEADRKTAVVRNMAHLLRAYELLNDYGKQVAVERLLELAQIPAYQSTDFLEETFKALAAEVARHPGRMQINGFHQPEENKSR